MRTLEDAGIGWRPPFFRADVIGDRPFEISSAYLNPNGYDRRPEIVAVLRFLGPDSNGDPMMNDANEIIRECSWSAALTPSREQIIRAMAHDPEPIGPCQFQFVPAQREGMSPFANIVTYHGYVEVEDYTESPPQHRSAGAGNGSSPRGRAALTATDSVPADGLPGSNRASTSGPKVSGARAYFDQQARVNARASSPPAGGSPSGARPMWDDEPSVPDDFDFGAPR